MLTRIRRQGLKDIDPQILVVTRLIPEAQGTSCDQRIEHISGTQNARILRVPFRDEHGILQQWVSRQVASLCISILCPNISKSEMHHNDGCGHALCKPAQMYTFRALTEALHLEKQMMTTRVGAHVHLLSLLHSLRKAACSPAGLMFGRTWRHLQWTWEERWLLSWAVGPIS